MLYWLTDKFLFGKICTAKFYYYYDDDEMKMMSSCGSSSQNIFFRERFLLLFIRCWVLRIWVGGGCRGCEGKWDTDWLTDLFANGEIHHGRDKLVGVLFLRGGEKEALHQELAIFLRHAVTFWQLVAGTRSPGSRVRPLANTTQLLQVFIQLPFSFPNTHRYVILMCKYYST